MIRPAKIARAKTRRYSSLQQSTVRPDSGTQMRMVGRVISNGTVKKTASSATPSRATVVATTRKMPRALTAACRSYASTTSAIASQSAVTRIAPFQGTVSEACWIGPECRLKARIEGAGHEQGVPGREQQLSLGGEDPSATGRDRGARNVLGDHRGKPTRCFVHCAALSRTARQRALADHDMPAMERSERREPYISVVIPVYNEERHIEACLASVLDQDYPADRYEVIVADGGSDDRTREIVAEIATRHPNVRLIDNPGRMQAAGLNRAILASRGAVIARQDGHAEWGRNHLRRSAELLAR